MSYTKRVMIEVLPTLCAVARETCATEAGDGRKEPACIELSRQRLRSRRGLRAWSPRNTSLYFASEEEELPAAAIASYGAAPSPEATDKGQRRGLWAAPRLALRRDSSCEIDRARARPPRAPPEEEEEDVTRG